MFRKKGTFYPDGKDTQTLSDVMRPSVSEISCVSTVMPNATAQALPEAGATQERTL